METLVAFACITLSSPHHRYSSEPFRAQLPPERLGSIPKLFRSPSWFLENFDCESAGQESNLERQHFSWTLYHEPLLPAQE